MSASNPSCLVLGATGFIGGHIALQALKEGYLVRGLRRDPTSYGHLGNAPIQWFEGDLFDIPSMVTAMQGVDVVFHAAAFYPTHSIPREVPYQVALALSQIECVIKATQQGRVRRFVYTSSLTTIGHPPRGSKRLADETDFYIPGTIGKSAYYESKIAMESRVLEAARNGFPAVVVNPTAVFGPGDVHLTLGKILLAIKHGYIIAWIPVTTNVIDVRDVAAGHLAAAQRGCIGERYILGGFNVSVKTVIDIIANQYKVHPPRFRMPIKAIQSIVALVDLFPFLSTGNHMRAIPYWESYNTEKAEVELDLKTRPFLDTVKDAINWFRENGVKA
jgi:dihydroflavonol-4-reductase